MTRNPNMAVIKIGYNSYAFEDAQSALELMAIMSKAVQVQEEAWSLRDETPCTYFLNKDSEMPELKFVALHKFNPNETMEEAKERFKREKTDREDLDQSMRPIPEVAAIAAPAPSPIDDDPF